MKLITLCIVSTLLFGVLATFVSLSVTLSFDSSVLLWINQHANHALDALFLAITQLGGVLFMTTAGLALLLFFLFKKQYTKATFVALSIGGVTLLNIFLKNIFERTRPDLWEWIIHETSKSFPSGHATASMALAACILLLVWNTKWRISALVVLSVYVLIVGLSRLYLGVHYPTDILGGWLLGIAWVSFVEIVVRKYQTRTHVKDTSAL